MFIWKMNSSFPASNLVPRNRLIVVGHTFSERVSPGCALAEMFSRAPCRWAYTWWGGSRLSVWTTTGCYVFLGRVFLTEVAVNIVIALKLSAMAYLFGFLSAAGVFLVRNTRKGSDHNGPIGWIVILCPPPFYHCLSQPNALGGQDFPSCPVPSPAELFRISANTTTPSIRKRHGNVISVVVRSGPGNCHPLSDVTRNVAEESSTGGSLPSLLISNTRKGTKYQTFLPRCA